MSGKSPRIGATDPDEQARDSFSVLIAGCTSDAGKSLVVAGMCRSLARRGISVAPFKAQNMSNNSSVIIERTNGGLRAGEIGRAQALQAFAAGVAPQTDMNPVLLKPEADQQSQLVVRGEAYARVTAHNYFQQRSWLRSVCSESLSRLKSQFDVVICEGAGSPAEINLRGTDIANMGLAEEADLPVLIVGDIDRGGVLAHFYGTYGILPREDQARIKGFIVNKFRGDVSLLKPGLESLEMLSGLPTIGTIPFLENMWIDAEDSLSGATGRVGPGDPALGADGLTVAAIRLPRVSNSTDVEALASEPGLDVFWTTSPSAIRSADIVVIPGSKSTVSDLRWLKENCGQALTERFASNDPIVGICGGFQMMCTTITDHGVEASSGGRFDGVSSASGGSRSPAATQSCPDGIFEGLGFLDVDIEFDERKTLAFHDPEFEIHHGRVTRNACRGWKKLPDGSWEGAHAGNMWGTHCHGLFENDDFRRQFLIELAETRGKDFTPGTISYTQKRLEQLDRIADAIEESLGYDWLSLVRTVSET